MSSENIGSITYILKSTAGASCDNSLVNIESAILNLIRELEINLSVKAYKCLLLAVVKNIFKVSIKFFYCIGIAWVERHGNHRLNLIKVNIYNAVIVCHVARIKFFIRFTSSVNIIKFPDSVISLPYR